jgi:hypothetical protein
LPLICPRPKSRKIAQKFERRNNHLEAKPDLSAEVIRLSLRPLDQERAMIKAKPRARGAGRRFRMFDVWISVGRRKTQQKSPKTVTQSERCAAAVVDGRSPQNPLM